MRPTQDELEQRWWHRMFKVIQVLTVPFCLVPAVWLAALLIVGETTPVAKITLTKWAAEAIEAAPRRMVVSIKPFLADARGERIGCLSAGMISESDPRHLTDSLSQCTLVEGRSSTALATALEKGFPNHRVHVGNGVVCLVSRNLCASGEIVRYSYEHVFTVYDIATLILIPAGVVLVVLSSLHAVYYRCILYIIFGQARVRVAE